jgi:hypothetical protein
LLFKATGAIMSNTYAVRKLHISNARQGNQGPQCLRGFHDSAIETGGSVMGEGRGDSARGADAHRCLMFRLPAVMSRIVP